MAKIEGDQNIPAELLDKYRATLTEKLPSGACRKRFPYRLPGFQLNGNKVTTAQKEQRQRWLEIRDKFKTLNGTARGRWFGSPPNLVGGLWYYDYFQMSGLIGAAEVNGMGGGVIKDIHHYTFNLPTGTAPRATIAIDTCDPDKSVPFFFGNGVWEPISGALALQMPFLVSLNSTQLIAGSGENHFVSPCSVSLIEYI
jgi:hypothetical protein